jgi:hypothetical protein
MGIQEDLHPLTQFGVRAARLIEVRRPLFWGMPFDGREENRLGSLGIGIHSIVGSSKRRT